VIGDGTGLPGFARRFLDAEETFTRIGRGGIGGKAAGLLLARERIVSRVVEGEFPGFEVSVPTLSIVTTDLFDSFMERNGLHGIATGGEPDDRIAHAFQKASLPAEFVGDLRALIADVHIPLAIRSSSLLEDDLAHPFAGVYATKMIPNNQVDVDTRFRRLVEAIKFVFASTFFASARNYIRSIGRDPADEKMAVIIQEIVGTRIRDRFYPSVSGVARSYNYYPTGRNRHEDGMVSLALGLGKTIVDGGLCWSYAPAYPKSPPPYKSITDLLKYTQTEFWAVSMGRPPVHDPIRETEYLVTLGLADAEADGVLGLLASTYDPQSDRTYPGLGRGGPRVVDFSPVLHISREEVGADVEVEFAVTLDSRHGVPARLGFLQVRPMAVSGHDVHLGESDMTAGGVIIASELVLGNGRRSDISDVVFLKPGAFDPARTAAMAVEVERVNAALLDAGTPYLLIGFGRWGSADPWLGVPVEWGQISGARVIVEATMPSMCPEPSQGSHFFHNMIGFKVLYMCVGHLDRPGIDWEWLEGCETVSEGTYVRHVRCGASLEIIVDGSGRRGIVRHGG
jgi:hypothetical protein